MSDPVASHRGRITTTSESPLLQATSIKTPIRRGAAEIGRYFLWVCLPLGKELFNCGAAARESAQGNGNAPSGSRFFNAAHDLAKVQNPRGVRFRWRDPRKGRAAPQGKRPGAVSQTVVLLSNPAYSARNDARIARIVLYAGDIDKSRLVKDIGDRRRLVVAYLDRKHTASG